MQAPMSSFQIFESCMLTVSCTLWDWGDSLKQTLIQVFHLRSLSLLQDLPASSDELIDAISSLRQIINLFLGTSWRFITSSARLVILVFCSITHAGIYVIDLEKHRVLWAHGCHLSALEDPCLGHSHLELRQLQTLFVPGFCHSVRILLG